MRERLNSANRSWRNWSSRFPASADSTVLRSGIPDVDVPLPNSVFLLPHDDVLHVDGGRIFAMNDGASDFVGRVAHDLDGDAGQRHGGGTESLRGAFPEGLDVLHSCDDAA